MILFAEQSKAGGVAHVSKYSVITPNIQILLSTFILIVILILYGDNINGIYVSNIISVLLLLSLLIVTSLSPFANTTLLGNYDFYEAHLVLALSGLFPHGGIRGVRDMENYTLL